MGRGGGAFGVSSWVGRWWLSGWVGGFAVGRAMGSCVCLGSPFSFLKGGTVSDGGGRHFLSYEGRYCGRGVEGVP